MYCGLISVCNRICFNIKSSDTKDEILDGMERAYGIQVIQRHWHRADEKTLPQVAKTPHLACLRSNGNPYYMYLTRYEDTPIIFLVDRKVQPGYEKPRILIVRGRFDEALFEDPTLLEVEMVRDRDEQWVCLVHDLVVWRGKKLLATPLPERLALCHRLFTDHYTPDPLMDVCVYQVKRYVEATQEGIQRLLDLSKALPYTSRGLYFVPYRLDSKPKLHNFDESLIRSVHRKVKDNPEFRLADPAAPAAPPPAPSAPATPPATPAVPAVPVASLAPAPSGGRKTRPKSPTAAPGLRVLWLRKTENPDVYDIHESEGRNAERLGTARVTTLAASRMLRSVFREATVAMSFPFECSYDEDFQKWVPVRARGAQAT